jgi:hypothetical protein
LLEGKGLRDRLAENPDAPLEISELRLLGEQVCSKSAMA